MATTAVRTQLAIKNILLTTDFSAASKAAIPHAAHLARRYDSQLFLLHVVPPLIYPEIPLGNGPYEVQHGGVDEQLLQEMIQYVDVPDNKKESVLRGGYFWEVARQVITERHVDMVVIGTHGAGGLTRLLIGSAAEQVFRNSPCPVMTIGPHVSPETAYHKARIMFVTDYESHSEHALNYALGLANDHRSQLIMMHVVNEPSTIPLDRAEHLTGPSERRLKAMIPPASTPELPPTFVVKIGDPATEIVREAKAQDADLIVMGAKRASGMAAHMPFNIGHKVVSNAHCPVLTVSF